MAFQHSRIVRFVHLLFLCLAYLGKCVQVYQQVESDVSTLLSFKSRLYPPTTFTSWTVSTPVCNWRGVRCANFSRVTSLELISMSITGEIPSSVGDLTFLEILDLSGNAISGHIPIEIGLLQNLRVLNLGDNLLEGRIPVDVSRCIQLQKLFLPNNLLHGGVPAELSHLKNLRLLNLANNYLTGNIPLSICNLTFLRYLSLSYNQLEGTIPIHVDQLVELRVLNLESNQLSGHIPLLTSRFSFLHLLHLGSNSFSGTIPSNFGPNFPKLIYLILSNNSFDGSIPQSLASCTNLEEIDLHKNKFSGGIPNNFGGLKRLRSLDLSLNNISGIIPMTLGNLPLLRWLNLSFNSLEGPVPTSGVFHDTNLFSTEGNKELCGGTFKLNLQPCRLSPLKNPMIKKIAIVATTIICAAVLSLFLHRRFHQRNITILEVDALATQTEEMRIIPYNELAAATDGFSSSNVIGRGAHGMVYKGVIDGSQEVAIKVSNERNDEGFKAEVEMMKNVRHRNIVRVVGMSDANVQKAVVYTYMPNGSLESWLHSANDVEENGRRYLSLSQRFTVVFDIAQGLHYLHDLIIKPIVHCDIKPRNVLLDAHMRAQLVDFGLAKYLDEDDTSEVNGGTLGYLAPECAMGESKCKKWDVYSFGILVLELFTAKRPTDDTIFVDGMTLRKYVESHFDNMSDILDPRISETLEDQQKVVEVMRIALRCCRVKQRGRMEMKDVVRQLNIMHSHCIYD